MSSAYNINQRKGLRGYCTLLLFCFSCQAWSVSGDIAGAELELSEQGLASRVDHISKEGELLFSPTMSWLETKRRALAGDIVALASYIDNLMGDVEVIADQNQSYVRLYLGMEESKYGDSEVFHRIRFSLDLPITKQRFRFILESEGEEDGEGVHSGQGLSVSRQDEDQSEGSITATFRYLIDAEYWDRLSFDWGVKVNLDPDLYLRARAKRSWSLSEKWSLVFFPDLFWFESKGLGAKTTFDFDHLIRGAFLFRLRSSVVWYERYRTRSYLQQASFYHDITERRAIEYAVGLGAKERQSHTLISDYFAQIRYRRDLFRGWLFYQMKLGLSFPRELDYQADPFVGFRLEVLLSDDLGKVLKTRMH